MNDTPPAQSKPPGPVPADDPGRVLTHVRPDTDDSLPHLGVVGDTYTILVAGADTAGRYTLIDMHVPPGGGPPPHRHDFEEMFTILDGEIEVTFRGVSAIATAGETINVPANAPHVFRNVSDRPATAVPVLTRRPGGFLQGGRRSGRAPNRGPTGARRCRHCRVHRQGGRARPEVPDRAAARRAETLIRETEENDRDPATARRP
jgi:quercetin dioxygenase-like cupin family protein